MHNFLNQKINQKVGFTDFNNLFASLIGGLLASTYYYHQYRIGENNFLEIIVSYAFLNVILFLPHFLLRKEKDINEILSFFFLFPISILGIAISQTSIYIPWWIIVLVGISLFLFSSFRIYKAKKKVTTIRILYLLFTILSIVFIAHVVWTSSYHNFAPSKLLTGAIDTYFHVGISNLIKSYHVASTGLHGIPLLKYHVGSHYLFAGLSSFLNIEMIYFYNISYPIIFIPLYFKLLITLIKRGLDLFELPFNQIIVTYSTIFIHVILFYYLSSHPYVSESSFISIILLIVFYLLFLHIVSNKSRITIRSLAVILFIFMLTCFTKFSAGFFLLSLTSYLFLRTKAFSFHKKAILFYFLSVIFFVFYSLWVGNKQHYYSENMLLASEGYKYFATNRPVRSLTDIMEKIEEVKMQHSPILHFFFLLFCLSTFVLRKKSHQFKLRNLILEALLIISICSYFIDYTLLFTSSIIRNSSDYYYFNLPFFFSSLFLFLVCIFYFIPLQKKLHYTLYLVCTLVFSLFYLRNFTRHVKGYNTSVKHNLVFLKEKEEKYKSINSIIHQLGSIPKHQKKNAALFIESTTDLVWKGHEIWDSWDVASRSKTPFVINALTGLCQINGFPKDGTFISNFSYSSYKIPVKYSLQQAKMDAKTMNFTTLYVISQNGDTPTLTEYSL